jgi:hypothetical protein
MKHNGIGIIGVLLVVLGAAFIVLQLMEREKSVSGSIAGGMTPILTGSILIGVSRRLERKKAMGAPADTPR